MEEKVVTFKTAKLAKRLGFKLQTDKYYNSDNPLSSNIELKSRAYYNHFHDISNKENDDVELYITAAPTQSLLQKWLRETYNWFLTVTCDSNGKFDYHAYNVNCKGLDLETADEIGHIPCRYDSWEDALDAGLFKSLKVIESWKKN